MNTHSHNNNDFNHLNEINLNNQNENVHLCWSYPLIELKDQRGDNNSFSNINLSISVLCVFFKTCPTVSILQTVL